MQQNNFENKADSVNHSIVNLQQNVNTGFSSNQLNSNYLKKNFEVNTIKPQTNKADSIRFKSYQNIKEQTELFNFRSLEKYKKDKVVFKTTDSTYTSKSSINAGNESNRNTNFVLDNFLLLAFLSLFILVAWIKGSFFKYFNQIFRAIFNYHESVKLYLDRNSMVDRIYFLLNIVFTVTLGIFLFQLIQIANNFNLAINPFKIILFCVLFVLALYFFKYITVNIMGFILDKKSAFSEYLHNVYIFLRSSDYFYYLWCL